MNGALRCLFLLLVSSRRVEIQQADNDLKKPDIASPRKADKEIEEKFEQELDQFSKRLEE